MKGLKVYNNPEELDSPSTTSNLATGISTILKELRFELKLIDTKHKSPDYNESTYSFTKELYPKVIFLKTDYGKNYSWQISPSKKWHNNTTMICYLIRKFLTK